MARINITIPDPLYERLDRMRDKINWSKVSAEALEKEANVIETQEVTDPDIRELIRRLGSVSERWHERGYQDGRSWATKVATRAELKKIGSPDLSGRTLKEALQGSHEYPNSFDRRAAIERWLAS